LPSLLSSPNSSHLVSSPIFFLLFQP
jgi:hypothetical protein